MKRNLFLTAALTTSLYFLPGCSGPDSKSELSFVNDMETLFGWNTNSRLSNIVYYKGAHSGRYVCAMDSSNNFGPTFEMRLKEVDPGPLKRLKVGCWFNTQQEGSRPEIIVDIRDKDGNTKEWLTQPGKDIIKSTGEWTWVELQLDLSVKNRNLPDNIFRIYPLNTSGAVALADDIGIHFEK